MSAFLVFFIATHHRDVLPQTVVGCEYPVIPGEIDSRLWDQGGQLGDEVQRLEDHMRGAVAIWCLQFIAHLALGSQ